MMLPEFTQALKATIPCNRLVHRGGGLRKASDLASEIEDPRLECETNWHKSKPHESLDVHTRKTCVDHDQTYVHVSRHTSALPYRAVYALVAGWTLGHRQKKTPGSSSLGSMGLRNYRYLGRNGEEPAYPTARASRTGGL